MSESRKKEDQFGLALCQSEYLGTQCDGHEDHGELHFATVNDGAMTWTEDAVGYGFRILDEAQCIEVVKARVALCSSNGQEPPINGLCGKY